MGLQLTGALDDTHTGWISTCMEKSKARASAVNNVPWRPNLVKSVAFRVHLVAASTNLAVLPREHVEKSTSHFSLGQCERPVSNH